MEARSVEERAPLDVTRYDLDVDLRDLAGGRLEGHARLSYRLDDGRQAPRQPRFDLVGLTVDSVRLNGGPIGFRHDGLVLTLFAGPTRTGGTDVADIFYRGRPADGLFFGTDREGRPVAFADNWPNRARWWFPSNDYPADKASVRWRVHVPHGWSAVANGRLTSHDGDTWVWESGHEIPVYTMVVGVARFQRAQLGEAACGRSSEPSPGDCAEISVWSLPGDSAYAVRRFARAVEMVDYYTELMGDFPYSKLAHVESATRFGGMENASAIFYAREPWEKHRMSEQVIAHETAHQWFGDAVTPCRWSHLWLSEGFASYFAPLFFRSRDGENAFRKLMSAARQRFLESEVTGRPVISEAEGSLFSLLDANNYQKGAWILHMLRGEVGDSAFYGAVRRYYHDFRHRNACTADLRHAMETESGEHLGWFFDQWLREPGYPQLRIEWTDGAGSLGRDLTVVVRQEQPRSWPTYRLDTSLRIRLRGAREIRTPIRLAGRSDTFHIAVPAPVTDLEFDPDGWILAATSVTRR
ncbi:MAG: M1 family metallopeptidase [Gemmatimonadota bacterium]